MVRESLEVLEYILRGPQTNEKKKIDKEQIVVFYAENIVEEIYIKKISYEENVRFKKLLIIFLLFLHFKIIKTSFSQDVQNVIIEHL